MIKAHRLALIYKTRRNKKDMEACHALTCTTTLCCNPDHLRWGTREENRADWNAKHSTQEIIAMAVAAAIEEMS